MLFTDGKTDSAKNRKPWKLILDRKDTKQKLLGCQDLRGERKSTAGIQKHICKEVKSSTKDDKRKYLDEKANEAQKAADRGDSHNLYRVTKELTGSGFRITSYIQS